MGRRWRGRRDGVDSGPEVEEGPGGVVDQVRSTDRWGHSTNYKNTLKFEHLYHMSPWTVIWAAHQPAGGPPLSETVSNTLKRSISVLCTSQRRNWCFFCKESEKRWFFETLTPKVVGFCNFLGETRPLLKKKISRYFQHGASARLAEVGL
jgi:hypothetical protein